MTRYGLDFFDAEGNMIAVFKYEEDGEQWTESPGMTLWEAWETVRGKTLDGDPISDRLYTLLETIFADVDRRLHTYAIDIDNAEKALACKGIALAKGESVAVGIERLYASNGQAAHS